jgi:glycosyltransferase involved in cell wall biosynthesis
MPLVILEALSCGMPVIASNVGSVSEVVHDGKNGHLIPKADPAELGKAILKLLGSYPSGIQDACRKSTEEFELTKITRVYVDLFHKVIDEYKS